MALLKSAREPIEFLGGQRAFEAQRRNGTNPGQVNLLKLSDITGAPAQGELILEWSPENLAKIQ